MSHSTVLVVGPVDEKELAAALAPFDENVEVEPYIEATREQQIAQRREELAQAAESLVKFRAGEHPYDEPISNRAHILWLVEEAPAEARLTDDELWAKLVERETWHERDENGAIWTTYNPKSRWDWYVVGGRWAGGLVTIAGEHVNTCLRRELLISDSARTFAVLTPGGEWHEKGQMGWWAMVADEDADWPKKWDQLVADIDPDARLWLVDVHI